VAGVRVIASAVSLVNGVWGIASGLYSSRIFGVQQSTGAGDFWIIAVGALLLLDSLVCIVGFQTAFYGSAALSILLVVDILLFGAAITDTAFVASALLGLITVALDILAITRKQVVSEENHPLNLPVFG
jgi:hypothetical protein